MQKTFGILLDMEKDLYTPSNLLFNVSTNDFESVELLFTITQDAAPLDLTGKNVDLAIKKPSGLTVYQSIEITDALDGNAAAMLSLQAYVEFGVHAAEVIVRNESQIMVTCPFYYFSREAIMDGETIESSGDWSALQEVLFSMDKKPILVDGIPTIVPEYIGQMAFDISENKRAFIANGLTETNWQVLGAGEGGGGIVDWASILGKPAAFPPEIHTHDFVDIQAKPAAYPPEVHNHEILDVTGLQAALDAKANTGELGAPVDHTHAIADVTGLQGALDGKADDADLAGKADALHNHAILDVTGLQAVLDGKADDADLTGKADVVHSHTFAAITEKPAAYPPEAHNHEILDVTGLQAAIDGKAPEVHNHEILDVTGLQAALDGKADDADLAEKADLIHNHEIADVNELQNILDAKALSASPSFTGSAVFNGTGAVMKYLSPSLSNALFFSFFGLDLDGITQVQRGYFGIASGSTPNTIVLASTKGDVELKPKTGFNVNATSPIKEQDVLLSDKYAPTMHNHTIANVTGLQAALDGKADDADLAAKANSADVYPKIETYTKTEVDAIASGITEGGGTIVQDNLSSISSSAALSANQGRILNETKANIADLTAKANIADVYAKTETYNKTEVDADLAGKANAADLAAKADAADLAAKADAIHSHTIANVTGLQAVLDGKADDADLTGKADAVHTHTFAQIADKPALYPAEAHNHAILDVTGLQAALDGKADDAHNHAIADVTGLQAGLDAKADDIHNHAIADVTGLQTALDGKADDADLTGKADAVHSHTFAQITEKPAAYPPEAHNHTIANVTGLQAGLDAKADDAHNHAIADVTGLQGALDGKADDADLAPFITESEADAKYEPIGAGGGGAWGEITGTISAQTDLQAALDAKADDADLAGKADAVHSHTIANVTGLQTALDGKADDADLTGKADAVHTHTIANVTGLQAALDAKTTATYVDAGDNFIMNTRMAGLTLWKGTQAAYDGLTPNANTLYFITG